MSTIYDNWERLVAATLRREQIRQLCHAHSREPSIASSRFSDFSSCPSPLPNLPFDSWYKLPNSVKYGDLLALEEIFVNGEPLSREKLNILLTCRHPPKKLKSGYYWYDKFSGFWGKQGRKLSQIISPSLNVGGRLQSNASNGNTCIYINGRQITKVEQRMLEFAGVLCLPDTHFWIDERGHYQFEGCSYITGCIWDKVGMKLLCSLLSLPFPPKSSNHAHESQQSRPQYLEQNGIQKLLLIGCNGSGTSAIFKQAVDILKPDCKPSNVDIEHVTSSIRLSSLDFSFTGSAYNYDHDDGVKDSRDSLLRFQLIKLQVKDYGESSTWLPIFEDVEIVVFCISLCDYDQLSIDDDGSTINKMMQSRRLFEQMITNPVFDQISFLLLLNKFDSFEEKIEQVPLRQCDWFHDFHPVKTNYHPNKKNTDGFQTLGQIGFHYIASKFKSLYSGHTGRKLYVSLVSSVEPETVDAALRYAREILNWDKVVNDFSGSWYSSDSSDSGSFSD